MKVMWLCNILFPAFARQIHTQVPVSGGWLLGAAHMLKKYEDVELHICASQDVSREVLARKIDGVYFYGYPASHKATHKYDPATQQHFKALLDRIQPDLVHIWGTEFPQSLAMVRAFNCPEKTIISIQGLCEYYTKHYLAYLPRTVRRFNTFRDLVRLDRLRQQQKKFEARGRLEKMALQDTKHVIGRTRWDRACARQSAKDAQYYMCNEILRNSFYENAGAWSVENCERHSIFVSQSGYPIKGFHLVLQAMPKILQRYPDAKLYTTGRNPLDQPFYTRSGYRKLLARTIKKLGLEDKVVFLGTLDEEKMCNRFLRSNVFVSASSIENSPNSVGEAMLLGVPVVASYVGGTMDLLKDQEEGFLYQSDAPYMLSEFVCKIFADDALASRIGKNAHAHAVRTHDPQKNTQTLLQIYESVIGGGSDSETR